MKGSRKHCGGESLKLFGAFKVKSVYYLDTLRFDIYLRASVEL